MRRCGTAKVIVSAVETLDTTCFLHFRRSTSEASVAPTRTYYYLSVTTDMCGGSEPSKQACLQQLASNLPAAFLATSIRSNSRFEPSGDEFKTCRAQLSACLTLHPLTYSKRRKHNFQAASACAETRAASNFITRLFATLPVNVGKRICELPVYYHHRTPVFLPSGLLRNETSSQSLIMSILPRQHSQSIPDAWTRI
ncbi:hypothetical protein AC579_1711 [Pseudocercospora musae]|uniref:Uncharacterized protein n=1 Tax=Pseudocercospora musae TaxID=113226 RepID=A0A139ICG0_9PEZI|nr:hypothetical protein AC579_1711 [Pseudocercospora musae]